MVRWALLCITALLFGGCFSDDQPPPPSNAPGARLTSDLENALDQKLREKVTGTGVPGASASVIFADGRQWNGAAGNAVLTPRQPMFVEHALPFDSVTKMLTAALALRLAEQRRLDLDEPVRRRYPAWQGDRKATVRDLLSHTSGAGDPGIVVWDRLTTGRDAPSAREFVAAADPPGPRTRTPVYSNAGFVIAGFILRRAAGTSVATAARRDVLAAPGGAGLVLQPGERATEPHVHNYWYPSDVRHPVDLDDGSGMLPQHAWPRALTTAGGMAGDVPSLARWGRELLGGRVLEPASLREMTRFRDAGQGQGYGLGLTRDAYDGRTVWGHIGEGLGHTELWHLPEESVTIAVSWNDERVGGDGQIVPALLDVALSPQSQ